LSSFAAPAQRCPSAPASDFCVGVILLFLLREPLVVHYACCESYPAMFTYHWWCIHSHPYCIQCTGDKCNDLHGYSFEKILMKGSPAHTGKQILIRGIGAKCLHASRHRRGRRLQHFTLHPLLVEQIDEVKILWESLASCVVPKSSLSPGCDATY